MSAPDPRGKVDQHADRESQPRRVGRRRPDAVVRRDPGNVHGGHSASAQPVGERSSSRDWHGPVRWLLRRGGEPTAHASTRVARSHATSAACKNRNQLRRQANLDVSPVPAAIRAGYTLMADGKLATTERHGIGSMTLT